MHGERLNKSNGWIKQMAIVPFLLEVSRRATLGGIMLSLASAGLGAAEPGVQAATEAPGVFEAPNGTLAAASSLQLGLNQPGGSAYTGVQGSDFVNYARLHKSLASGIPLASLNSGIPAASSPLPPQSSGQAPAPTVQASAPKEPNWARRHAMLLAGLGMTGAGMALMATGGPEQSNGSCITGGAIGGGVICTPPGPVWLGHQRLAGLLLVIPGVPLAIVGVVHLFQH